jgi:ketosteroid isomerase-like protein
LNDVIQDRAKEGSTAVTEQKTGFDFEAMRHAIEELDAETLIGLYADDVEMITVNKSTTPSSPQVRRGKEEIAEFLRDVCGRAMTHRIENEVVGDERVAFNEVCEYPDGTKVLAATTLEVRDGRITHQTNVEAWDE